MFAVQGLKSGPFFWLGALDEINGHLGKNSPLAIEPALKRDIAVVEEMRFNNALEGGFTVRRLSLIHI